MAQEQEFDYTFCALCKSPICVPAGDLDRARREGRILVSRDPDMDVTSTFVVRG